MESCAITGPQTERKTEMVTIIPRSKWLKNDIDKEKRKGKIRKAIFSERWIGSNLLESIVKSCPTLELHRKVRHGKVTLYYFSHGLFNSKNINNSFFFFFSSSHMGPLQLWKCQLGSRKIRYSIHKKDMRNLLEFERKRERHTIDTYIKSRWRN